MWSKTWSIALAIISRLTVTDCLGPPPHRPYQSASSERIRDPEREIDTAYRMMEELARRDALKRHKPPVQNGGNSVTEVEYVDDATEPRHRYLGNKYQPRLRFDESPDTTKSGHHHRQGFSRTSFVGPGSLPRHGDGDQHKPQHHGATRDGPNHHEAAVDGKEPTATREDDPKDPAAGLGVRTRSGAESFQPIAAAVAMQENMNVLDKETTHPPPPPPPPSPKHHQISSADLQQPEPDHHHHHHDPEKVNGPVGFGTGENKEIRPPDSTDGDGKQADRNGVRMMALQNPEIGSDSETGSLTEVYLLAVIAGCSVAGFVGLLVAGVCYYRLKKKVKAACDVDYPAYGVTGPNKEREGGGAGGGGGGGATGDRKLAQSAQMYHYQHQKQQMIASERLNSDVNHRGGSDAESEDENEEGDYTVFECPGLATNDDMEVRNPLFNEQTPVTAPLDVSGTQTKK